MGGKGSKPKSSDYRPIPRDEETKTPARPNIPRLELPLVESKIVIRTVEGSNPRTFLSEVGICEMCAKSGVVYKLCIHKICIDCYEDARIRKLDHCPICTLDRDAWYLDVFNDILGYKITTYVNENRQYQNVGCLLTLQMSTKNNRLYCSGTGDKIEMKYFNEYNKYAAERVYVVGASFFGETSAVLGAMSDYAAGKGEIVSLFNHKFIYRVGWEIVEVNAGKIPNNQQTVDDRVVNVAKTNCCAGIHFFSAAKHAFRYAATTGAINWDIVNNPTIFMRRTNKKIKDSNCETLIMSQLCDSPVLTEPAATDTKINYRKIISPQLILKDDLNQFRVSEILRVELLRKALEANVNGVELKIDRYVTKPGFYGLFDVDEDTTEYKKEQECDLHRVGEHNEMVPIFHIPRSWDAKLMKEFIDHSEYSNQISTECLAFVKSIGYEMSSTGIPIATMERMLRRLGVLKLD